MLCPPAGIIDIVQNKLRAVPRRIHNTIEINMFQLGVRHRPLCEQFLASGVASRYTHAACFETAYNLGPAWPWP